MRVYNQDKLVNVKASVEIAIDTYQQQIDKLKLGEKEVEKLKRKIAKQEKKLKELENMIWLYKVGDIVLLKDDLREVKITKLINHKINDKRYIYVGDLKTGFGDIEFCQDELISKPFCDREYIKLLQEKISDLKYTIRKQNFL